MNFPSTTVTGIYRPLTGDRVSLRWRGDVLEEVAEWLAPDNGRVIDGSGLLMLPSLYDADAHMPHVPLGVRVSDLHRALAGGVSHMNVALPWQLAQYFDLRALIAETVRFALPRLTPVLSVTPNDASRDFPAWIATNATLVTELMPGFCKLYSADPHFDANLDAVQRAGLIPMIWFDSEAALNRIGAALSGPVYFRHATSARLLDSMRGVPGAIVQTSPHFLLPIAAEKAAALTVLPAPPSAEERKSLCERLLGEVDVIASDHVAPQLGDPTGPGLQTQQHFLPALLAAAEFNGWSLDRVIPMANDAPAAIFRSGFEPGFALVDPGETAPVGNWPRQPSDRAPYAGMQLRHRVIAVGAGRHVRLV